MTSKYKVTVWEKAYRSKVVIIEADSHSQAEDIAIFDWEHGEIDLSDEEYESDEVFAGAEKADDK